MGKKIRKSMISLHGAGIINAFIAFISFLPYILVDRGAFVMASDVDYISIPLSVLTNNAIKSGNLFWNWSIDLGSSLIPSTAFSIIGSPFFWISLPFKASFFPYLVWWIFIIKYGIAGLTSFEYLKRYVSDERYALLGSVLYAFSAFQTSNLMFFSFHDVVALFPLLLIGMDKIYYENKRGILIFAVALNALTNYYFFVAEVIFCAVYYVIHFVIFERKKGMFTRTCLEVICGTGISAVITVPSYMSILSNPRSSDFLSGKELLFYDWKIYLQIMRAALLPGEMMNGESCITEYSWSSCQLYLPMVGMVFVVAFLISKKMEWLKATIITCCVFAIVPVLNSSFQMLNAKVYHRWYFMFILLLVLATLRVLENKGEYRVGLSTCISSIAIVLFVGGLLVLQYVFEKEMILKPTVFWIDVILALLGVAISFIGYRVSDEKGIRILLGGVIVYAIFTTTMTTYLYRCVKNESATEIINQIELAEEIEMQNGYRFQTYSNYRTMCGGIPGMGSTTSVVSRGIFDFYQSLGMTRGVLSEQGPEGTEKLVSAKYYFAKEPKEEGKFVQTIGEGDDQQFIYEDEKILPVGMFFDSYMPISEYEKIPNEEKVKTMLKTVVISDDKIDTLGNMAPYSGGEQKQVEVKTECFEDNVSSELQASNDGIVFYSIPYDRGWHAEVNGETAEIIETNGFIAMSVSAGKNVIKLNYVPPGFWFGIVMSLLASCVSIIYCSLFDNIMRKSKRIVLRALFAMTSILLVFLFARCISNQYNFAYSDYQPHTESALFWENYGKLSLTDFKRELPVAQTILYPFWHIGVCAINEIAERVFRIEEDLAKVLAGTVLTTMCLLATILVYVFVIKRETKEKCITVFPIAAMLMFAGPYYLPFVNSSYYIGQLVVTSWHNPTTIAVQAIGTLCAWLFATLWKNEEERIAFWLALTVFMGVSTIIKPSFYQMFIPGMIMFCLYQLIRTRFSRWKTWRLCVYSAITCIFPLISVILSPSVNYGEQRISIGIGWLFVLKTFSEHPIGSALISVVFPLSIVVWDSIRRNIRPFFLVGILAFVSGFTQYACLYITQAPFSGDFAWGAYLGTGILFVSAFVEMIKNYQEDKNKLLGTLGVGTLAIHIFWGAKWFSDFL